MSDITNFDNIGLDRNVLRGIYSYGFTNPSKIQQKTISHIINGKEIIAQSHSGTGKTGAFIISALQLIDVNLHECQVIVITPTHELAKQVHSVATDLAKYLNINIVLCVGGTVITENIKNLDKCQFVIGTPGRCIDMIKKKYINSNTIKLLILDEADEMLSGDFRNQIKTIIMGISKSVQICLFSATITENTLKISEAFLKNPMKILIEKEKLTLDEISQFYVMVKYEKNKYNVFKEIYNMISIGQSIVYRNTQPNAKLLYDTLIEDNNTCGVIYSSMSALDRTNSLKDFRNGKFRILISTDLLSRGIDIQKLSVVINYDIPIDKECYIHRIGRSGRFGKRGVAINLVTLKEYNIIKELEKYYSTTIIEMPDDINSYL